MTAPKINNDVYEFGVARTSSLPRLSGGTVPVVFAEQNFKTKYVDEHTGEGLLAPLIRAAIEDGIMYFNDKVWQPETKAEMEAIAEYILVRFRLVLCNKRESSSPDVRARLVATEVNKDGKCDAFAASTPPLEGKKSLFTKCVSRRRQNNPLRISFVDIRKAYFNAVPKGEIFMKLPPEIGMGPDVVAKQVRCVYGTGDAGRLWEDTYTRVLNHAGSSLV